jgi:hypothetical protein
MIEHVAVDRGHDFARCANELREHAPLVRRLAIDGSTIAGIALSPAAAGLLELELDTVDADGVDAIARSSHFGRLRRLEVAHTSTEAESVIALIDVPLQLDHLGLRFPRFTAMQHPVIDPLVASPARRRLRSLCLEHVRIGDVSKLGVLGDLRRLVLRSCGELELSRLVALAPSLPHLEELEVTDRPVGSLDVAALLDALPSLRRLRLHRVGLDDRHAFAIAESPAAARLRRIDLTGNQLGDDAKRALRALSLYSLAL